MSKRSPYRPNPSPDKNDLVNENIPFYRILLIDDLGETLGEKSKEESLRIAREKNLDLLCVAPKANPPVCKILDYGKFKYELQKKSRENKKNQKIIEIKEVQLSVGIGIHDFNVRLKAAKKFLENGDKVKITIRFKKRQMAYTHQGKEVIDKFIVELKDISQTEKEADLEGKTMIAIISSTVDTRRKKNEKSKDENQKINNEEI